MVWNRYIFVCRVREMKRKLHEARLNALAGEDEGEKGGKGGHSEKGGKSQKERGHESGKAHGGGGHGA